MMRQTEEMNENLFLLSLSLLGQFVSQPELTVTISKIFRKISLKYFLSITREQPLLWPAPATNYVTVFLANTWALDGRL